MKIIQRIEELENAKLINPDLVMVKLPKETEIIKSAEDIIKELQDNFSKNEEEVLELSSARKDFLIETTVIKSSIPGIEAGAKVFIRPSHCSRIFKTEKYDYCLVPRSDVSFYAD